MMMMEMAGPGPGPGHGRQRRQQQRCGAVLQALPCVDVPLEELNRHPRFNALLSELMQRMDGSGLHRQLKPNLQQALEELQSRRRHWLAAVTLQGAVDEALEEQHAAASRTSPSPADRKFWATVERCWVLGQVERRLDPGHDVSDPPDVRLLGLERQHLHPLLPPPQEVHVMRRRLPREVEARLQLQCRALLSYIWPQIQDLSADGLLDKKVELELWLQRQNMSNKQLHQLLRSDRLTLQRQSLACVTVLSGCSELLRSLIRRHRLSTQPQLDQSLIEYLTAKGQALSAKLRFMRLELQQQTFDPPTVGAHRRLRQLLDDALGEEESRRSRLRAQVELFGLLGPEFEQLVVEYGGLRSLLDNRRWALRQFNVSSGDDGDT